MEKEEQGNVDSEQSQSENEISRKRQRLRSVAAISDNSDKEKEDGAMILMSLSRDFEYFDKKSEEDEDFVEELDSEISRFDSERRSRYKCKTCNKVFHSYQALGGHRASHNVGRIVSNKAVKRSKRRVNDYECPVCGKVFSSGQALGGHKRSHWAANSETNSIDISFRVCNNENFWM